MARQFTIGVVITMLLSAAIAFASETGTLRLDVLGDIGKDARPPAQVLGADGKQVAEVAAGSSIALKPGEYKLVLPIIGGKITKDNITIEAGRTRTVIITNVAVLNVTAKDRNGKDPGLGVIVRGTAGDHEKVASFNTGEKFFFAPSLVDVHVDAPPQGYDWHGVALRPGEASHLTMEETAKANLVVQPVWSGIALDKSTRVVIYRAGTQKQVAVDDPSAEHRFVLDPGDYDIYVENHSGKGAPYATDNGIHLNGGDKVSRTVPLGDEAANKEGK